MIALGCAKNLVDAERMLGVLTEAGFEVTADARAAEVLVVNTCGFIGPAKEESIAAILEAVAQKQGGRCRAVVVTGCLSQRYQDELWSELPEVDGMAGVGAAGSIVPLVQAALEGKRPRAFEAPDPVAVDRLPRRLVTWPHLAYLRIAEGCDNCCAYCVIPSLRGPLRSRPLAEVVAEAESLAAQGVRELVLVAQDTTAYGREQPGAPGLAALITALGGVALSWVRVLYAHPAHLNQAMLDAMAASPNCCAYLDLPLQHASERILAAMGRPPLGRGREAIARLRRTLPGVALRSTFLVGFPGEDEADFQKLLDFMVEIEFDHLGVFTYSAEEGTRAAALPGAVPPEVAAERRDRALRLQQRLVRRRLRRLVGRTTEVMVDVHRGRHSYGRTQGQAPEVDGRVILPRTSVAPGQVVPVRITGTSTYDLRAELI